MPYVVESLKLPCIIGYGTRTENLKKRASATKLFFMFSLFLIKNTKKLKLLKKDNYYKFLSDGCFNVLRRTPSSSFVLVSYSWSLHQTSQNMAMKEFIFISSSQASIGAYSTPDVN